MSPNDIKENGGPGKPILKSTADERKCVTPCTRDPIPPDPKAPEPPEEAKIGQPPLGDEADSAISNNPEDKNYVPPKAEGKNEDEGPSTQALLIKCPDTLE